MNRFLALLILLAWAPLGQAQRPKPKPKTEGFVLAPAVAVEAEEFRIESGWRVLENGHGNMMVDIVGFNHISGERLLGLPAEAAEARAVMDVNLPEDGEYRIWVRYEYPPFSETRFGVEVRQGDQVKLDRVFGSRDNPRFAFDQDKEKPQYDPPWGPEGLVEEAASVSGLKKGAARIVLKGVAQPRVPGRAAARNIDLIYLTRDTGDHWRRHFFASNRMYPILDAFRESRGPRWEVRFTNRGTAPVSYSVHHHYNRHPWGVGEGVVANVKPGEASSWIGLTKQDTSHYGLVQFGGAPRQPFDLEIRPAGSTDVRLTARGASDYGFYLPHYPQWKEPIVAQVEAINAVLRHLEKEKPIGKAPTLPLCYGGWIPVGRDDEVGRAYAKLYAAIGMRSTPAAAGPALRKNLDAENLTRNRSEAVMSYRNPPVAANIAAAVKQYPPDQAQRYLQWFDYGDEIGFGEWVGMMVAEEVAKAKAAGKKTTPAEVLASKWRDWLKRHRTAVGLQTYWRPKWGAFDPNKIRPDSSAEAAAENPALYVDSLIFYEDTAIAFAAAGMKAVKAALGDHVWCGANYSGHPFYLPTSTMYVKWFRGGAADMGRHSEYFWQVAQPGPMINGYFAEHFRAGMRDNPNAVLRQYTMPHAPGNSDASFLRSAFSHLAHGATMLDFFGIGMNDAWTENYVDFRFAPARYDSVRQVTHALGFVEDVLPSSKVVPSRVALLVSESTERWDFAGIATDQAGHAHFGPDFRKTRLHHHIERLGLWKALTFLGHSPDLVVEGDLTAARLKDYKVLVLVGDCLPAGTVTELERWVANGGVVLATSRAGALDSYLRPVSAMDAFFGLDYRSTTEPAQTFLRPRQELPYLTPVDTLAGDGWRMPVLVSRERIKPKAGTESLATIDKDRSVALTRRSLGKGNVFYTPTYPGISSLWAALQPPIVADRSPTSHLVPVQFDPGARKMLEIVLASAQVAPPILASQPLVDARLIRTKTGWLLPIANYQEKVGQPIRLELTLDGKVSKASSAYCGSLPIAREEGHIILTLPKLGYGDIIRLDQ